MSGGEAKLWTSKRSRTPSRRWTQAERHRGDVILLMQVSADQNSFRSYLSLGGPRRKRRGSAGEAKRWMLPRFRTPSTRWTQATESQRCSGPMRRARRARPRTQSGEGSIQLQARNSHFPQAVALISATTTGRLSGRRRRGGTAGPAMMMCTGGLEGEFACLHNMPLTGSDAFDWRAVAMARGPRL